MTINHSNESTKKKQVLIFDNSHDLTNHLVKSFSTLGQEAIDITGRYMVALSGGKSPTEFYCKLSNIKDFDIWNKTQVFLADERFVALDDNDSNFRMIKENFLNYTNIPQEYIHPVNTSLETPGLAAESYKQTIIQNFKVALGEWPRFDFTLLGIGEDGHTASIFPQISDQEQEMRYTMPVELDYLNYDRVSLTLPLINYSRNIFFLITGESKADIVKKILDDKEDLPATKVVPNDGNVTFLLDKFSAAKLSLTEGQFSYQGEAISVIK